MSRPEVGERVRIMRPDRPEHAEGVVISSHGTLWPIWVEHRCDCYVQGVYMPHPRGYEVDEIGRPA